MEDHLKKLYEDPEFGLSSIDKFYKKVKEKIPNITRKQVEEFIKSQAVNQITKPVNTKNRKFNSIISHGIKNNYQIDIFILPHPQQNKGYKYLLTCIDVYSRFVDVEPLKCKTGDVVLNAFKSILGRMGKCVNLNCDEGSEFVYKPFQKYCEDNDIIVWMSDPEQENKNAIIERWHRTLRNIILKYVLIKGKGYIDVLPKIINNYNTTEHSSTNLKPIDIWKEKENPIKNIVKVEMKFNVGDRVRHLNKKGTFEKSSSTGNYTITVYTITEIEGNSIYLGSLKKPFRDFELIKAVENGNKNAETFKKTIEEDRRKDLIKRRLNKEGIL